MSPIRSAASPSPTQLAIDVLDALPSLSQPESLARIRKEMPIYVFSGERDPVGANIQGLVEALKSGGLRQAHRPASIRTRGTRR